MRKLARGWVLCAMLPLHPSFAADSPTTGDTTDAVLAARAGEIVARYHDLGRFSGTVLVARQGQEIFSQAVGLAERALGVPNTVETRFRIGSLSKQFTAAALLKLEAAGKLSLDDPVSMYLPDYPRPQADQVRLRHVLSHSSGIPSLGRRGDGLEDVSGLREPIALAELLDVFDAMDLLFEPGSQYRYSNSAYTVAAAVVEAVSGQSLADYLREALFIPAGMHDTGHYDPQEIVPMLAHGYAGYEPDVSRPLDEHPSWGYGAGGIYSTVRDLLRWTAALESGGILPDAQLRQFMAPHQPIGEGLDYAYGWWVESMHGTTVINHGGTIDGYVCDLFIVPDQGLVIAALANHMPRIGANIPTHIAQDILQFAIQGRSDETPPAVVRVPSGHLHRLAGPYSLGPERTLAIEVGDGVLAATAIGAEPWTLFSLAGQDALDRDAPAVVRSRAFVEALATEDFERIVANTIPDWDASAATFREPWDRWLAEYGPFVDASPVEYTEGQLISVVWLLRFERRLAALEVVMNQSLQYGGWWQSADVPQARQVLRPTVDGRFLADGFRWRKPDQIVALTQSGGRYTVKVSADP